MPFPLVQNGGKFKPSASLSNAVRRHLNESDGFIEGQNAAKNNQIIRIPVFNTTGATIPAGKAVSLQLDGTLRGDAYPIVGYDEDYPCFGVTLSKIESGKIGDCVLCGLAVVSISGGTEGAYLKPVEGGDFELGNEGVQIINVVGGTNAVVLLGDYWKHAVEAGPGINSDLITGGTVALNLVGDGSNITVTPVTGSTNGQMQVTFTGSTSGGGGLDIPPYSSLTFGGGAPDYGLGHTFILAVKAGDVGFYDDGGGAVGKWTNKSGTSTQYISGGTAYHATEDGWLRISVVDNGLAPGACLGFYSSTGGFPLYKYGSFSVSGIGYPDYIALAGGTASNSLGEITDSDWEEGDPVPGPSTPPQNPKLGITSFLPVPAGTPIKYYASTAVLVRFAPVSGGGHYYYDLSNELEWTPNCAGWLRVSILDDGAHSSDCFRLYVGGVQWSDAVPLYKCGTFQGGATGINSAVSGGTAASITLTGGTGSVIVEPGNENVTIDGSTNGRIRISVTGGSGGGGYVPRWGTHFHYSAETAAEKNWMYYDETYDQTIVELYSLNPRHMTAGARGYLKGNSLAPDLTFSTAAEGYLFCFAEIACDGNATASNPGSVHAVINGAQFKVCSVFGSDLSVGGSVVIPVRANQRIELYMSNIDTSSSIIGMIFYENGKDYRYPDDSE